MTKPTMTTFTSINIAPDPNNPNNGLFLPPLTNTQISEIPAIPDGAIFYNSSIGIIQSRQGGNIGNIPATPVILEANAAAYETANTQPSQMYLRSNLPTGITLKVYTNAWHTITIT